jgi:hypothetical protein
MSLDAETQERLRVAKEDAAALAADGAPTERKITVRELLTELSKAAGIPATAKAVLEKVLGAESFEDKTTFTLKIEMYTDPWQLKPTLTEVPIDGLPTTPATTTFSSNTAVQKQLTDLVAKIDKSVADITKATEGKKDKLSIAVRAEIAKAGPATAKLDQIKAVLNLPADVEDNDIRWRVGELVGMLAQHAAVERMYEGDSVAKGANAEKIGKNGKLGSTVPKQSCPWPTNLATADFDAKSGQFKPGDLAWGRDGS